MARLNEFLKIVSLDDGRKVIRCTRCDYDLCPATENHRLYALMHEGSVQEAGPPVNPHHLHGDKFVFRQFYCPNCVALLSTEGTRAGLENFDWLLRDRFHGDEAQHDIARVKQLMPIANMPAFSSGASFKAASIGETLCSPISMTPRLWSAAAPKFCGLSRLPCLPPRPGPPPAT